MLFLLSLSIVIKQCLVLEGKNPCALLQPLSFGQTRGGGEAKGGREQPLVVPRSAVLGLRGTIPPWDIAKTPCFELPLHPGFTGKAISWIVQSWRPENTSKSIVSKLQSASTTSERPNTATLPLFVKPEEILNRGRDAGSLNEHLHRDGFILQPVVPRAPCAAPGSSSTWELVGQHPQPQLVPLAQRCPDQLHFTPGSRDTWMSLTLNHKSVKQGSNVLFDDPKSEAMIHSQAS